MKTYTSNTYYLFDHIAILLMFAGLSGGIAYLLKEIEIVLVSGLSLSTVFLLIIILLGRKIARIEFNHNNIVANYRFTSKEVKFNYSSIIEIKHITAYGRTGLNIIRYRNENGLKDRRLKITTVVSDNEYMEFIKWIKGKNENIKYVFLPSDSKLKGEYYQKFEK